MTTRRVASRSKLGPVLMALLGTLTPHAQASSFTHVDAAWKEAVILAGVAEESLIRPRVAQAAPESMQTEPATISFNPHRNEVVVSGADSRARYYALVQEFLRTIHNQKLVVLAASTDGGTDDPAEAWVRERMAWRVRSRTF